MNLQRKALYMTIGGILALAIAFGGFSVLAQTDDGTDTLTPDVPAQNDETPERPFPPGFGSRGLRGGPGVDAGESAEYLADALGISVEELEAAHEEARVTAIEQAVADGLLTQEQADQILEGEGRFPGGRGLPTADKGEFLADALGISLEELEAAQAEAMAAKLATLVEEGVVSQEQADMMTARHTVQSYLDTDSLAAVMQEAYETAVADALADGVISQEQADLLLENLPAFDFGARGFRGGHHGPGGRGGHGPRGGFGGFNGMGTLNQAPSIDIGDNA